MASLNVFYKFQNLGKALHKFSLKKSSQKTFWILKFVIDKTLCRTIQGVRDSARNLKSASRFALVARPILKLLARLLLELYSTRSTYYY